jgi:hypothetical protein
MSTLAQSYQSIANINTWFKLQNGTALNLADIPSIIPLRWTYFAQNWNQLLPTLLIQVPGYIYPDLFQQQLNDFTNFINLQRNSTSIINPLSNGSTLYRFYTVFDNISINSINLTVQEQTIVTNTTTAISQYGKNDFLAQQANIISYRDAYADTVGLEDPTYNSTFNRSSIPQQTTAVVADSSYLATLQASIQSVDFILANLFAVDTAVDPFALARANANNPAIDITPYSSGQLVRFQYGDDLESLATRYLGDPNKWIDIALANGLQPPYIDEVGQTVPLQTNADGNQINIAATDAQGNDNSEKFYVNQTIFLQSSSLPFPNQRNITNININPVTSDLVLTLSGTANLGEYTTAQNASVLVYAPDTVNSALFILIPSTEPLPNNRQETVPWFLASAAQDEKQMGIDLLLGENDDLVFTPNHDLSLSYSLQNAVQAMRLKIVTELGELRYHQSFGLINIVGNKNNNLDGIKNSITNSLTLSVSQDSRFDRIETLNIYYIANQNVASTFVISMEVRLAGGSNQVIPISFNINYST